MKREKDGEEDLQVDQCSDAVTVSICHGEGAQPKGKALDLPVDLPYSPCLWSCFLGNDRKNGAYKWPKWVSSIILEDLRTPPHGEESAEVARPSFRDASLERCFGYVLPHGDLKEDLGHVGGTMSFA